MTGVDSVVLAERCVGRSNRSAQRRWPSPGGCVVRRSGNRPRMSSEVRSWDRTDRGLPVRFGDSLRRKEAEGPDSYSRGCKPCAIVYGRQRRCALRHDPCLRSGPGRLRATPAWPRHGRFGRAGGGSSLGRRPGIIRYVRLVQATDAGMRHRAFRSVRRRIELARGNAWLFDLSHHPSKCRCDACPFYSKLLLLASGGCANWLSTTPLPIPRRVGQINTRRPRNGRLQECNDR
jgi:hypothetical protein